MEKKFAHVTELKSTQELIDIYNHATDYQEQFVKEVYDELLARGVDGDKLFRERERYIQEQNKYLLHQQMEYINCKYGEHKEEVMIQLLQ